MLKSLYPGPKIFSWYEEDLQLELIIPNYDRMFSFETFSRRRGFSEDEVQLTLNSRKPINTTRRIIGRFEMLSLIDEVYFNYSL